MVDYFLEVLVTLGRYLTWSHGDYPLLGGSVTEGGPSLWFFLSVFLAAAVGAAATWPVAQEIIRTASFFDPVRAVKPVAAS